MVLQNIKLEKLTTLGFILGLILLLTNDFLLKPIFHNSITGKLSDFAGLFIFPLFWLTLFPYRKNTIYILTAAFFTFWKSPYSQPLIDSWNSLELIAFNRVIDYTDLTALLILPVSYYYDTLPIISKQNRLAERLLLAISLFAFVATSYVLPEPFYKRKIYEFDTPKADLIKKVEKISNECKKYPTYLTETNGHYEAMFCSRLCKPYLDELVRVEVIINIEEIAGKTTLSIYRINPLNNFCRSSSPKRKDKPLSDLDREKLELHIFEKEFIDRLRYGKFEN